MGVYVFQRDFLVEVLSNGSGDDIGRDILPGLVAQGHVASYTYPGYWADASTIQAYWDANMSLLAEEPALNLYAPEWVVHTRSQSARRSNWGRPQTWMGHCSPMAARSRAPSNAASCPLAFRWARAPSSAIVSSSMIQSSNRAQSSSAV